MKLDTTDAITIDAAVERGTETTPLASHRVEVAFSAPTEPQPRGSEQPDDLLLLPA